jgi:hypothetical protein
MTNFEMNRAENINGIIESKLSIYIPVISARIIESKIKEIFNLLDIGLVSRVDFINKTNNNRISRQAFVHFEKWYDTRSARNLQTRILDPTINARIVYDDPHFWPLLPTNNPAPEQPEYANETNIKEYNIAIMQSKVRELEETVRQLNIRNNIHESNIMCLFGNIKSTIPSDATTSNNQNSWENLSDALNSQSLSNKRIKSMSYTNTHVESDNNTTNIPYTNEYSSPTLHSLNLLSSLSSLSPPPPPIKRQPKFTDQDRTPVQRVNPSCCGQISEAWFPDFPSMENISPQQSDTSLLPPPPSPLEPLIPMSFTEID